jgi:HlyD family secretion protein
MRLGWSGAAVALSLVAALALGACSSGGDDRYAAEVVRPGDVVERVSAPGVVQAAGQADLQAPAAARVERLVVKDGQRVRRGQLVAQLSSDQVDDQVKQAQAAADAASSLGGVAPTLPTGAALSAFQQVQSQVATASAAVIDALRSALPLLPQPQRRRLQAQIDRAQVRVAELQRQADQAARQAAAAADAQAAAMRRSIEAATAAQRGQAQLALELATDQQRRLTLRAPLAGTVQLGRTATGGGVTVPSLPGLPEGAEQALQGLDGGAQGQAGPPLRVGSEVDAGQTVATVFDTSALLVAAEVDETDIALVRPGQPSQVELDAFPAATFPARVRRVAVAPTAAQSAAGGVTYQVDLVLGEADGVGRPVPRVGMTATAAIEVRRAVGKLSVAGSALVGRAGGQAVFVVERGKVRLRPVQVAADGEDRVAIAAGLRAGERVVSRGAERLRDGQDWPGA